MNIIDTPDNTTGQIIHLQADKVTDVIRYLTTARGSAKLVTAAEARALGAAGIRLGLVFEVYGGADGVNDIDAADGTIDAQFCLDYLPTIGAPMDGTVCVYFACDTDFSRADIQSKVLPYFAAVKKTFAENPVLVGVYGSGAVCRAVCSAGSAKYAWLSGSMGWTNSKAYLAARPPELVLVQDEMDTRLANMDVDTNYALGPFGSFLPFGETVA